MTSQPQSRHRPQSHVPVSPPMTSQPQSRHRYSSLLSLSLCLSVSLSLSLYPSPSQPPSPCCLFFALHFFFILVLSVLSFMWSTVDTDVFRFLFYLSPSLKSPIFFFALL
ncbi:hypothetical protein LguiA_022619 [Lonicera macranthoides]